MKRRFLQDTVGWGFLVWLLGYFLGIIFFFIVPHDLIGWLVTPLGIAIALWVLLRRIQSTSFQRYISIAIVWTIIAILCDYFFLVRTFKTNTYYKLDIYLYYAITFLLPILVGWKKTTHRSVKK